MARYQHHLIFLSALINFILPDNARAEILDKCGALVATTAFDPGSGYELVSNIGLFRQLLTFAVIWVVVGLGLYWLVAKFRHNLGVIFLSVFGAAIFGFYFWDLAKSDPAEKPCGLWNVVGELPTLHAAVELLAHSLVIATPFVVLFLIRRKK